MGKLPNSDGVFRDRLVSDLDLSLEIDVTWPLICTQGLSKTGSTQRYEGKWATYQDANVRSYPSPELSFLASIAEGLITTIGRVAQREPHSAVHVGKENGHLQRYFGNVLPDVVQVLRRPQGLRHDCARVHNAVVEYPERTAVLTLHV